MTDEAPPHGSPEITAIMAVLNGAEVITEAVRSVQAQTFQDWELIIVDDGSTDGTGDVIRPFADEDPRITILTMPKRVGVAAARNHAFAIARGWLTAITDADDIAVPERFTKQRQAFLDDPELGLLGTQAYEFGDWGSGRLAQKFPESQADIDEVFRRGKMGVNHPTAMYRTALAQAVGGYDEACTRSEDLGMFRKMFPVKKASLSEPLIGYRTAQAVTIKYVWRETYWAYLAQDRNALGGTESVGYARLPPRRVLDAAIATARNFTVRTLRERGILKGEMGGAR